MTVYQHGFNKRIKRAGHSKVLDAAEDALGFPLDFPINLKLLKYEVYKVKEKKNTDWNSLEGLKTGWPCDPAVLCRNTPQGTRARMSLVVPVGPATWEHHNFPSAVG